MSSAFAPQRRAVLPANPRSLYKELTPFPFLLEIFKMIFPLRLQIIGVQVSPEFLVRVDVEALSVALETNLGNNGPTIPPVVYVIPVHALKKWVCLDAPSSA